MNKVAEIINQTIKEKFNIEVEVSLTRPRPEFGDFATNIAMQLAGSFRKIHVKLLRNWRMSFRKMKFFEKVEIAGPGFLNLRVSAKSLENY